MRSRHLALVDTVSFSEKVATRSIIQTYDRKEEELGCRREEEGKRVTMDASFDALVTVTQAGRVTYAIVAITIKTIIDFHECLASSTPNLSVAQCMCLTEMSMVNARSAHGLVNWFKLRLL